MAVGQLKRVIKFDNRKLTDVAGYSADQLRQFYTRVYPELSTATVQETVTADGIEVVFTTGYKSKG